MTGAPERRGAEFGHRRDFPRDPAILPAPSTVGVERIRRAVSPAITGRGSWAHGPRDESDGGWRWPRWASARCRSVRRRPPTLDGGFGTGGIVVSSKVGGSPADVVVQPDGRLAVVVAFNDDPSATQVF